MNKRVTRKLLVKISIELEPLKFVKVKAHKRLRSDKIEKVRSHYRRLVTR